VAGPVRPGEIRKLTARYLAVLSMAALLAAAGAVPASAYPTSRTWAHDSIGSAAAATTWYLAEGCTSPGFETWVVVLNPGLSAAHIELTFMTRTGPVTGPAADLQPGKRRTFNVADTVPLAPEVSTSVVSDVPVVAERAMYGNGRQWGHDSIGIASPRKTWYLAEGCAAGGFETWILVQNPGAEPARVTLTYMTAEGPTGGPTELMPPGSRRSFNAAESVAGAWEVSTQVSADKPVAAERAMYGNDRTWAHDSIGASAASTPWFLAEGCTALGFETWILVQNPNGTGATVNLTYMTPGGVVGGPSAVLEPGSRKSFDVSQTVPGAWQVSTRVDSNKPVVAERAMYGNDRTWGTDSIGAAAPQADWFLAEGSTARGFETWILVQNPQSFEVGVEITYSTEAGTFPVAWAMMPPDSRMSFDVSQVVGRKWEVATTVHADHPVIAERAMYGDATTPVNTRSP
jgi:hypothetical protein